MVERRVDFNRIKKVGQVFGFMKAMRPGRWVQNPVPVVIGPAGWAEPDCVGIGHLRFLFALVSIIARYSPPVLSCRNEAIITGCQGATPSRSAWTGTSTPPSSGTLRSDKFGQNSN